MCKTSKCSKYLNDCGLINNIMHDGHCSICFEELSNYTELECGHKFHKQCIYQWTLFTTQNTPTCPLCRNSIDTKALLTDTKMFRDHHRRQSHHSQQSPTTGNITRIRSFNEIDQFIALCFICLIYQMLNKILPTDILIIYNVQFIDKILYYIYQLGCLYFIVKRNNSTRDFITPHSFPNQQVFINQSHHYQH